MRVAPASLFFCECVKNVAQVLLISSLTVFWVDLMIRGWQNCERNQTEDETITAAKAELQGEASDSPAQRSLRGTTGYRYLGAGQRQSHVDVACQRHRVLQKALLTLALARFQERSNGSQWRGRRRLDSIQAIQDDAITTVLAHESHGSARPPLARVSLYQMRSPVDRLLHDFISGGNADSPLCVGQLVHLQTSREEAQECFINVMETPEFQNSAAKTFAAAQDVPVTWYSERHDARAINNKSPNSVTDVADVTDDCCHHTGEARDSDSDSRDSGKDSFEYSDGDSGVTIREALAGVCRFNHIAISEAPGISALVLLESFPRIAPDRTFFPQLSSSRRPSQGQDEGDSSSSSSFGSGSSNSDSASCDEGDPWGKLDYITEDLRVEAGARNQVDEVLYSFVTAKLCDALRSTGLLRYPQVVAELETSSMGQRCSSLDWLEGVMTTYGDVTRDCRLFQPWR